MLVINCQTKDNIDFLYDLKEKNETDAIFFNKFLTDGLFLVNMISKRYRVNIYVRFNLLIKLPCFMQKFS